MSNRDAISRRIRALRAKTVANGCTEAEAIAAAEMLAELLAKYNLTLDEAEMRESPFTRYTERDGHADFVSERLWKIADAVSFLTGVRYWVQRPGEIPCVNFFGFDHEVEVGVISMSEFQPEIGQMLFGQPTKQYEASELLEAALSLIERRLSTVLWNNHQKECPSPFSNTGARFETDGLVIEAYSWDEDVDQPFNFQCGDIEISWYKRMGRGMSVNKELTPAEVEGLLLTALEIIGRCDIVLYGDRQQQLHTYFWPR